MSIEYSYQIKRSHPVRPHLHRFAFRSDQTVRNFGVVSISNDRRQPVQVIQHFPRQFGHS